MKRKQFEHDLEFCRALVELRLVDVETLAARLDEVPDLDPRIRSAVESRLEAMQARGVPRKIWQAPR